MRPSNLSKKMMRVIFSVYLAVSCVITGMQFLTEYLKTKNSILVELQQVETTFHNAITTSLWQYNENQINALISGLIKMPIIERIDVKDKNSKIIFTKQSYHSISEPLSIFSIESDLNWVMNDKDILLGSLTLHSSSEIILDRVLFGFTLIAVTEIIKISILFWLFIWAFDRYLASPLKEFMAQVNAVKLNKDLNIRIKLSNIETNELTQLQDHMNNMLSEIESDQKQLLDNEKASKKWLEMAVAKRTEELRVSNEKLQELATRDSLTGVLNRGSFFETAQHLFILSQRQKTVASFIMIDLDHFKIVNDTHGHFIGDKVLIHFTDKIKTFLRKSDLIGRIGGEEFAIFLPDTKMGDAFHIADKIRMAISDSIVEVDSQTVTYTVSLGIESSVLTDHSVTDLFKRADLKLYKAKDKGRNRIEK
jgi:diguanylate cyclase (GGDEF)-like protein